MLLEYHDILIDIISAIEPKSITNTLMIIIIKVSNHWYEINWILESLHTIWMIS